MNIGLARTFLEILEAGNLNKAAERLHVTQSTVTMRINALEDLLGQKLLVRSKSGVALTNSGFKFKRYAEMLVQVWHQAKREVALPKEFAGTFNIGFAYDLWAGAVEDWLPWLRRELPQIALSLWAADAETLGRWLASGLVDAAVSFEVQPKWDFETEKLFADRLIEVSREERELVRWHPGYIYVDWGEEFRRAHALAYPVDETAAITFGEGGFALQHILAHGGAGYFPLRAVRGHLEARRLFAIPGAPEFARPVFFSRSPLAAMPDWLGEAVEALAALGRRYDDVALPAPKPATRRKKPSRRGRASPGGQ